MSFSNIKHRLNSHIIWGSETQDFEPRPVPSPLLARDLHFQRGLDFSPDLVQKPEEDSTHCIACCIDIRSG